MADQDKFVRSENIKHLLDLLQREQDPERRRFLEQRLNEERNGIISAAARDSKRSGDR